MNIEVTQVWLSLNVQYNSLPKTAKPEIIDDLMDIEHIAEVCHYDEIMTLLDISDDFNITEEIEIAKNRIKAVFSKYAIKI